MPINPALLIAAPMLQDLLVDKTGLAMSGGTVTMYHDNSRTTLKNWYYQSGSPGNYTYIRLPNPLTLSAAGTICDINGVDTIPFYYPYDEEDETISDPYYVTIVNHNMTNQITRENFPYNRASSAPLITTQTVRNLIVNNGFWRNALPNYINSASTVSLTLGSSFLGLNADGNYAGIVAPSQHDGFSMPDIQFIKTNLSSTDTVTFTPFPLGTSLVVAGQSSPEYYISHQCTVAGSAQSVKCYQFPIALHLNNLSNLPFTVSIQAQNVGGTSLNQNVLTLKLLQYTGTGTTSPTPTIIANTTLTLSTTWQPYSLTSLFPSSSGLNLGNGEDDAWYLQVEMPLNLESHINFTKPALFLTDNVIPTNDFQTYDEVNSIISSPRTGDIRISLDGSLTNITGTNYYSLGWVPLNDGTIGNSSSNATTRKNGDTWRLFNTIWSLAQAYSAPGAATSNPIAQMYSSAASPVGYGGNISSPTTAIQDFNNNRQLSLSRTMGRVLLGSVPSNALLANWRQVPIGIATVTGNPQFTVTNTGGIFLGQTVVMTSTNNILPGTLSTQNVYYITNISGGNAFQLATTFVNAMAGTATGGAIGAAFGTVTIYFQYIGTSEGEYGHTQLLAEIAQHNHSYTKVSNGGVITAGGAVPYSLITDVTGTTPTNPATPMNVTQPGTFYNMFMKL